MLNFPHKIDKDKRIDSFFSLPMQFSLNFHHRSNVNVSFKRVEGVLHKARRASLPKTAKSVKEIVEAFENSYVHKTYAFTDRKEESQSTLFYKGAFEEDTYSFCFFASEDIVQAIVQNVIESERKLYVDGTFKITPMGVFKQVLILFAEIFGSVRRLFVYI